MGRCTDAHQCALPAAIGRVGSKAIVRLAVVVGAVIMLLRLMFSERARKELEIAAASLQEAVNEVDARLARMSAETSGHRVRLRGVPSSILCDVMTDCKGRSHAAIKDAASGGSDEAIHS